MAVENWSGPENEYFLFLVGRKGQRNNDWGSRRRLSKRMNEKFGERISKFTTKEMKEPLQGWLDGKEEEEGQSTGCR